MTRWEFAVQCALANVDVGLALENDDVRNALAARDDAEVVRLLDEEF